MPSDTSPAARAVALALVFTLTPALVGPLAVPVRSTLAAAINVPAGSAPARHAAYEEGVDYEAIEPALVDLYARIPGAVSAGTGIVISSDGDVVTNNHVIRGAIRIAGEDLGDQHAYPVVVLGADPQHDVALVRLVGASGLTVAPLADSDTLAVGDDVAAVGNAGGKGTPTISTGRVTALDQAIVSQDALHEHSEHLRGLIQVSARVLPGDSGGPLVSAAGQVMGMDTAAESGNRHPTGFAIPINQALEIASRFRPSPPPDDDAPLAGLRLGDTLHTTARTVTGLLK